MHRGQQHDVVDRERRCIHQRVEPGDRERQREAPAKIESRASGRRHGNAAHRRRLT
jgi:hypothetical protein